MSAITSIAMRGTTLSLILAATLASPVDAQTTLAWRFRAGDSFRIEHCVVQSMTLATKSKPLTQKSTVLLETRWQVKGVKDHLARVQVTVETMASKSSTDDGAAEAAAKDDRLWLGAVLEIDVDDQGRLRELRGYDELLKKLAQGDASRLKILRALKPAAELQALFQEALGPLPDQPVKIGDRWSREATEAMNLFGTFAHVTEFRYAGPKESLHRVDTKTATTFKNPRYAIENDVFRVLKGEVTTDEGSGHFLFDADRGRMQSVERQGKLAGELTLETLGRAQRVRFASESRTTIRVRD
jgi:hypothetical protein